VTPLQLLVIRAAGNAKNLASSVNISAFNIGNALGAALGGAVVASGAPLPAVGIAAAAVALAGTVLALLGTMAYRPSRTISS
jgi:DHA1 family inner membrane transport protein